jgi:ribosomal protein L29
MKFSEVKKLSAADRAKKLTDLQNDLIKIRGQVETGTTPKSPGQISAMKKDIARILTANRQDELSAKNNKE